MALATATSLPMMAGGLVTNTNQNAAFLRQLSQEAIIDITGLYMNPAGTAFLAPGAHVSFNIQNAKQSRDIATTFPLFALNTNNRSTTHEFKGDAYAPVIPSIQFSYNWEKWSINANFALGGGGGKCEFDQGLGSFEALTLKTIYSNIAKQYAEKVIPQYIAGGMTLEQAQLAVAGPAQEYAQKAVQAYSLNAYMKGRQYYFGLSMGATYKAMDNLAVFGGIRAVYSTNNYNGYIQDIKVNGTDAGSELTLNNDQTGFGITPILGIDWKIDEHWNVAAKYEFKTRLRLENKSEMNTMATEQAKDPSSPLNQFADGTKVVADIPSLLTMGVQYSPIKALRLQAGYHWYGDKNATQHNNKQKDIDKDTWEITAGVEYDLCKWVTLSGGWQTTQYGLSDAYMNDLSFNTNSNSWGVGARVNLTEKWNIDLGFMQTIYKDREVKNENTGIIDLYSRTNRVLGIGLNFNF